MAPMQPNYFDYQNKALDPGGDSGGDHAQTGNMWRKMVQSPDTLRQRIIHALAEIFVVYFTDGPGSMCYMDYLDRLEQNAFGNFRTLLERITLTKAMGVTLTYLGNTKADPVKGNQPDENMAREIMQLFTIGLYQLNPDGSLKDGKEQPTYDVTDVQGLARVFTGWNEDRSPVPAGGNPRDTQKRDLKQEDWRYETGAKSFLGVTVPAGTSAKDSLRVALDTLCNHPNVGPFIGKQLIQRLVTSNPSPAYVARVSAAFANNGQGVRGDMKALIRAILLDVEARDPANSRQPTFGKLREPMFRYANWARAWKMRSLSGWWKFAPGYTSSVNTLNQGPLQSPSVFNFFRPGYVPPTTQIASRNLVAPEFQITNDSSVAGFVNYMENNVFNLSLLEHNNIDFRCDYEPLYKLAGDSAALLAEINLVLAAGQVSDMNIALMKGALDTITVKDANDRDGRRKRIHAALTMVIASPEYIVQK